jgi:hypothetical protein
VLLVPAVLPTLFLSCLIQPLGRRRALLERVVFFAIGCALARIAWGRTLAGLESASFYKLNPAELLGFRWEAIRNTVVPYFFLSYKHVWLVFGLTAVLALVLDVRRYVGPLLVAGGLSLSIFILYGSVWKTSEHESSLRYILHGMYGWTLFFLASATPWIEDRIESLNRRLGGKGWSKS